MGSKNWFFCKFFKKTRTHLNAFLKL